MRLRKCSAQCFLSLVLGWLLLSVAAAAQSMPAEKLVNVFGQHIRYADVGQGPALIFVHGLGGQSRDWAANLGPLSRKFHVYALDQIGHGHSDKPLVEYRIQTFVEFLHGFMQELEIPRATLVGESLGGWIVADFAAQHPDMVDKLVLVDAAGLRAEEAPSAAIADSLSSLAGTRKILELAFYNKQMVTDALVRQHFEDHLSNGDGYAIERFIEGLPRGEQREDGKLVSIKAPTLVVWGRDDQFIPLSVGEGYQQGIAGAKLVVLDQCGHFPPIEKPEQFNKALLDFLGK